MYTPGTQCWLGAVYIYSVRRQVSKGNVASEANDIPESFDMSYLCKHSLEYVQGPVCSTKLNWGQEVRIDTVRPVPEQSM